MKKCKLVKEDCKGTELFSCKLCLLGIDRAGKAKTQYRSKHLGALVQHCLARHFRPKVWTAMKTKSENVAAKMSDLQIEAVCGHLRDYCPQDTPFNAQELLETKPLVAITEALARFRKELHEPVSCRNPCCPRTGF